MIRMAALVLAGCFVVTAAGVSTQQSLPASVQLEAARQKAALEGDLPGAIKLYQAVVDTFATTDRPSAATALLLMAECYEKLGRVESQAAYERIVRDYRDQRELADRARARLAALAPAAGTNAIAIQKVWSGFDDEMDPVNSALSPDGRSMSYVHWATGNMAVRDLATGTVREVTTEGGYSKCSQYGWESAWSPSGREIAYHWLNCDNAPPHHSLRIVRADGTNQRVLFRSEDVNWPAPMGWTPDGKHIVLLAGRNDRTWQIGLVSVADGSHQVLKTLDWRKPGRVSLSPDGKYLAYDLARSATDIRRDLYVLAVDGRAESRVNDDSSNNALAIWAPGGGALVFLSDRTGTESLWRVAMTDGKAVGKPELVKESPGMWPIGFAPDGTFYYGGQVGASNVLVVGLDPDRVVLMGKPELAVAGFEGNNALPTWSPDGRHLAYLSRRSQAQASPGYVRASIVIREVATGAERLLGANIQLCTNCGIRWSPDGRSLAARAIDDKGRSGIHAIDVATAAVTPLVLDAGRRWWAEWLPGSSAIMFHRIPTGGPGKIFVRALGSGVEREIAAGEHIGMFAPSPDGKLVAYSRTINPEGPNGYRELIVAPLEGGEGRSIAGRIPIRGGWWWNPRFIQWTPDGRHLLFGGESHDADGSNEHQELWKVPANGGTPEMLGQLPSQRVCDLRISPSGRQIVFDDCRRGTLELWAMKNVLPRTPRRD